MHPKNINEAKNLDDQQPPANYRELFVGRWLKVRISLFSFHPQCPISKDNEPSNVATPTRVPSFLSIPPNRRSPSKSEGSSAGSSPPRSSNSSNRSFRFRSPGRSLGFWKIGELKFFQWAKWEQCYFIRPESYSTLVKGMRFNYISCWGWRVKGFLQISEPWCHEQAKRTIQTCSPTSWGSQEWFLNFWVRHFLYLLSSLGGRKFSVLDLHQNPSLDLFFVFYFVGSPDECFDFT